MKCNLILTAFKKSFLHVCLNMIFPFKEGEQCSFLQLSLTHFNASVLSYRAETFYFSYLQSSEKYHKIIDPVLLPLVPVSLTRNRLLFSRVFPSRYSVSRPVETHMSGSSKNSASHAKVSVLFPSRVSGLPGLCQWVLQPVTRGGIVSFEQFDHVHQVLILPPSSLNRWGHWMKCLHPSSPNHLLHSCTVLPFVHLLSQGNNNHLFSLQLQDNFRGTCPVVLLRAPPNPPLSLSS